MKYFTLELDLDYKKLNLGDGHRAFIECYLPSNFQSFSAGIKHPAMIVCPGGGYEGLSKREDEPVALQYLAANYATFILNYSVAADAGFPRCLFEALTAIKTVREHAEEWEIDADKIAMVGFSAGGHLTATVGAYWNSTIAEEALGDTAQFKPNALVLSYPVITSGEWAHRGSFDCLVGEDASKDLLENVSIEKQVTASYPPTFLWHTATDGAVPVQNSILMANALADQEIPFELHIYPSGPHGLSLSDERTAKRENGVIKHPEFCEIRPRRWLSDSLEFLSTIAFKK